MKIIAKIISSLLIIGIVLVALIEVFPEEMKQLESKAWFEFVETTQNYLEQLKTKIHNSTSLEPQRSIDDIVNDEITQ